MPIPVIFPRVSTRGLIEAFTTSTASASASTNFRVSRHAASLKLIHLVRMLRIAPEFPRVSTRGLIEACLISALCAPFPIFPRVSTRGLIEASLNSGEESLPTVNFRVSRHAASLKLSPSGNQEHHQVIFPRVSTRGLIEANRYVRPPHLYLNHFRVSRHAASLKPPRAVFSTCLEVDISACLDTRPH